MPASFLSVETPANRSMLYWLIEWLEVNGMGLMNVAAPLRSRAFIPNDLRSDDMALQVKKGFAFGTYDNLYLFSGAPRCECDSNTDAVP
jgi:hypothetical protein